jgi:hypothetical protein
VGGSKRSRFPFAAEETGPFDPSDTVVPIFSRPSVGLPTFLGTGFFVAEPPVLLSAAHCFESVTDPIEVFIPSGTGRFGREAARPASLLRVDADRDIAALRVVGYRPTRAFAVPPRGPVLQNRLVASLEYSQTRRLGNEMRVSRATRLGTVTRSLNEPERGKMGENMLEVSFAALRGASGAPVVYADSYELLGMLVGNADYELHPTHVYRCLDDDDKLIEEARYLLPQGLAVSVQNIRDFLADASAAP